MGVTAVVVLSPSMETAGQAILTSDSFENEAFAVRTKEINLPALGSLQLLRLPAGLTAIEEGAFEGAAFEAVIIPEGCTTIESRAFANCKKLVYVRVPAGANIAEDAFAGCENAVIDRGE